MKNGMQNLAFRFHKRVVSLPCLIKNGFRDRITLLKSGGISLGLLFFLAVMFMLFGKVAGVALAIAPAIKLKKDDLAGDENKLERELLEKIERRMVIEGVTEGLTKDQVQASIKESMKQFEGVDPDDLKKLVDKDKGAIAMLVKQGLEINQLKQNMHASGGKKEWKKMIGDQFADETKLQKIRDVAEGGAGMAHIFGNPDKFEDGVGVVQKQSVNKAGTITTSVVTTDSGGNALLDLMSVEDLRAMNLQEPFIEDYSTVTRTSKPVYPYADFEPNTGDAAFTAENAVKSQMDLKVVVHTVGPKKVTGFQTLSTESVEDVPRMQTEAINYMLRKVLLKRQYKILFGTGAGSDPVGVAGIAKTYNQAGLLDNYGNALSASLILQANGNGVQYANLYDAISAAALQIYSTANYTDEMEYYPNLVILNPTDLASLKLKKNQFGQYLFPELQWNRGAEGVKIDNLTVVAKRQVPVGKIMIGDFTRLNIINYIDYAIRIGWINDNLTNNLFTMVGETRFFTVIRSLDQNAFIYDSITNILNGANGITAP